MTSWDQATRLMFGSARKNNSLSIAYLLLVSGEEVPKKVLSLVQTTEALGTNLRDLADVPAKWAILTTLWGAGWKVSGKHTNWPQKAATVDTRGRDAPAKNAGHSLENFTLTIRKRANPIRSRRQKKTKTTVRE